jgi:hypothetical protein
MKVYDISAWEQHGIREFEGELHHQNPDCFSAISPEKKFLFDKDKRWFTDLGAARKVLQPLVTAKYHEMQRSLIRLSKLMNELGIR